MEPKLSFQPDSNLRILTELYSPPIPASALMADANFFLESNKRSILSQLQWSRLQSQKTRLSRFAAVCCAVIAIGAVFALSPEARAFANRVFTAITEWFSPAQNLSGVTFEIGSDAITTPDLDQAEGTKMTFESQEQADRLLPGFHARLHDTAFELKHGFVANNISYMRYTSGDAVLKIIQEPIQEAGSVSVTFFESWFHKNDTAGETIYYTFTDGDLYGLMVSDKVKTTLLGENISEDQLIAVFCGLRIGG